MIRQTENCYFVTRKYTTKHRRRHRTKYICRDNCKNREYFTFRATNRKYALPAIWTCKPDLFFIICFQTHVTMHYPVLWSFLGPVLPLNHVDGRSTWSYFPTSAYESEALLPLRFSKCFGSMRKETCRRNNGKTVIADPIASVYTKKQKKIKE